VGAFSVCVPGDHGQACSSSSIDSSCSVADLGLTLPNCGSFNAFRYVLAAAVALWGLTAISLVVISRLSEQLTTRAWKTGTVLLASLGYVACALMLTSLLLQVQWMSDSGLPDSARGACFGLLAAALAIGAVVSSLWLLSLRLPRAEPSALSLAHKQQQQATELHATVGSRWTPVLVSTSPSSMSALAPQGRAVAIN
jgi:hypothetical protein